MTVAKMGSGQTKVRRKSLAETEPNSEKGRARRELILRGVIDILAREGYRQQSLRELAKGLGMEAQHVLYYFANRDDLLQRVIELWDEDTVERPEDAGLKLPSLDLYIAAVRRVAKAPGIGHLYLSLMNEAVAPTHPAHDFMKARQGLVLKDLTDAIMAEQEAGAIPPTFDPARSARQLSALANGLQLQALIDPDCDPAADVAAAIAQLRSSR
ncbi:TetR/AcrR family transcriptional regulator [Croceicoccus gelatinilyticus]|uniref:TetR/AcrR family transcriptional regulator n=1 Tax=Croceicoccus gelatinilyticus TaxID=2835536 RepID=UPI001BCF2951|nr:TetR/AcrR family transcriptional regulator [Croceicoccus gelatinilyticus]MBS7671179.1 TetR/AcrR family transcriptional regulator [Croceicoccus gelatinilyticus]